MDLIYSRRKIKFKKPNKKEKLKLLIGALVFIISISIILYIKAAYPIFISSCKSKANSMATNIVNEEVQKVVKQYTYNDLVNIEKDENGKILLVQGKVDKINELVSQVTKNIQQSIDSSDTGVVYINLGKVTGMSFLSYVGPTFKIELERAGRIETKLESHFVSKGINQTIHKINLNLKCKISILTPLESIAETIEETMIVAETVIVGEVPDNYYYYDDINSDKVLDAQ